MSDFDKEAEREKLRKKYADDEDTRADTKRMSELLLKGATMTNQHCDECGDPLFSHNGQTFCPTCQATAQQPADDQQQADTQQPTDTQQANGAQQPTTAAQSPATEPESSATQPQSTPTDTPATNGHPDASDSRPPEPTQPPTQQSTSQLSPPTEGLTTARQSLIGTITRFSQQAAKTDDPRRAKELLAAAREAAETLRALEFE
jgi:uncharacterized Zn finger protein (UPF0148 family)